LDDPNIPLEFIFKPSDYRLASWFFEDINQVYQDLIQLVWGPQFV
jgi:hypothetical protein